MHFNEYLMNIQSNIDQMIDINIIVSYCIVHLNEWVTYPYPNFRVWYHTMISWHHTLISGCQTLKSGYGTGKEIAKITVIWSFLNQLIIGIYCLEVDTITHLDFCDPAIKFFLNHPKNLHWNIELDDLVGVGWWVGFSRSSLQISSFC